VQKYNKIEEKKILLDLKVIISDFIHANYIINKNT
jgi:hypothetical protein